jgi:hypothetical protein
MDRVHTVDEAIRKVAGGALRPGVCKERLIALDNILMELTGTAASRFNQEVPLNGMAWGVLQNLHELQ